MILDNYYQIRTQAGLTSVNGAILTNLGLSVNLASGSSFTLTNYECNGADRLVRPTAKDYIRTRIPSGSAISNLDRYMVFGDGNEPVATDDYSISGSAIENISILSLDGIRTITGYKLMYSFKYTGTTTAVIRELCIFDNFGVSSQSGRKVALWREVFDTPLQVPAGSIFTYNLEVEYN